MLSLRCNGTHESTAYCNSCGCRFLYLSDLQTFLLWPFLSRWYLRAPVYHFRSRMLCVHFRAGHLHGSFRYRLPDPRILQHPWIRFLAEPPACCRYRLLHWTLPGFQPLPNIWLPARNNRNSDCPNGLPGRNHVNHPGRLPLLLLLHF